MKTELALLTSDLSQRFEVVLDVQRTPSLYIEKESVISRFSDQDKLLNFEQTAG